jgi:hypothetical protein
MASLVPNIMPKHGLERRAGTGDSGITGENWGIRKKEKERDRIATLLILLFEVPSRIELL